MTGRVEHWCMTRGWDDDVCAWEIYIGSVIHYSAARVVTHYSIV